MRLVLASALALLGASSALQAQVTADLRNLTAAQIIQDYKDRKYTPTQLTQAYLDRITLYNPVYNAYTTMNPAVLADAAALTALLADPTFVPPTPVWGVPTAIKDPMDMKGIRTTVGSSFFGTSTIGTGGVVAPGAVEMIPGKDAGLVRRLREGGALFLGKTSVPDFSLSGSHSNSSLNGITRNAYNVLRTPGGSSGGSGTAVAAGLAALSTAEETGSSITNPASAASLVGIRNTIGTVSATGVFPLAGHFRDVSGPLAKTVRDAAGMLDVMAGLDPGDTRPSRALNNIPSGGFVKYINDNPNAMAGKNIGRINVGGDGFSLNNFSARPETITLYNRVLTDLQGEGATIVNDPFSTSLGITLDNGENTAGGANAGTPSTWRNLITTTGIGSNTQSWDVRGYLSDLGPNANFTSPEEYDTKYSAASGRTFFTLPGVAGGIPLMPSKTSVGGVENADDPATRADLDPFRTRRDQILALFKQIMAQFNLSALVLPQLAAPVPQFPDANPNSVAISRTPGAAINIMGTPGVVVPGGYFADGTPFATYFVGEINTDAQILAFAADYEAATNYRIAPNLVLVIPEPTSIAFIASAMVILTRRRRAS